MSTEVTTEVKENMLRTTCGLSQPSLRTHLLYPKTLQNPILWPQPDCWKGWSAQEGETLDLKLASPIKSLQYGSLQICTGSSELALLQNFLYNIHNI